MRTVLVSFIGTGQVPRNEKQETLPRSRGSYLLTTYKFKTQTGKIVEDKTSIFGSALLRFLINSDEIVDSWLVMGTPQSNWCDLIEIFPIENQDEIFNTNGEIWSKLDEESKNGLKSDIRQDHLDKWQAVLTNHLQNTKVFCRLVGTATTPDSQNKIFQALLDIIKDGDRIVFDVTHGLRNQPIITSFALMYLRYLRNVKNVEFYYGAMDLQGEVVKLDFCNEILNATEAVAIYEQTSNFIKLGDSLNLNSLEIEKISFANEMNKPNKGAATKVLNELRQKKDKFNPLQKSLEPLLEEALDWQSESSLPYVYQRKAGFAFEHEQYFQAIALLWEGIRVAGMRKFKINKTNLNWKRNEAKDVIENSLTQEELDIFKPVEYLRNAILHGTDCTNSTYKKIVDDALNDQDNFRKVFKKGQLLLNNLLKS